MIRTARAQMVALTLLSAGVMIGCGDEDTAPAMNENNATNGPTDDTGSLAPGAEGSNNAGAANNGGSVGVGDEGASAEGDDRMNSGGAAGSADFMDDNAGVGVDDMVGGDDSVAGDGMDDVMLGGLDAGVDDEQPGSPEMTDGEAPTFARVVEILNSRCSPCHTGGNAANADLRPEAVYTTLTSAPAFSCASTGEDGLVVEGDADGSLLIHLVEGTANGCGPRMPPPSMDAVPADEVAELRAWIDAGASLD